MAWEDVDLSEVRPDNEVLPEEQEFVFELLKGAKLSKFYPDKIEVAARVAEGEFKGKISYFSYPSPEEQPWVLGVFKRMEIALGTPQEKGEHPVDYLNRVAGSFFISKIKHRVVQAGGDDVTKAEVKIGNVKKYKG